MNKIQFIGGVFIAGFSAYLRFLTSEELWIFGVAIGIIVIVTSVKSSKSKKLIK